MCQNEKRGQPLGDALSPCMHTGGFCFLISFGGQASGVSAWEEEPVSKHFQVLMDSNSSQGLFCIFIFFGHEFFSEPVKTFPLVLSGCSAFA